MIFLANTIMNIRQELSEQVGKEVKLTAYESRNRVIEHTGVLSNTYPSVFIIDLGTVQDSVDRVSYSYIDILTGSVELQFN
ncbi:MAG: Veg family protein [Turicibacter sp.]|nr:Veg family protein [Turicibacter sp.]